MIFCLLIPAVRPQKFSLMFPLPCQYHAGRGGINRKIKFRKTDDLQRNGTLYDRITGTAIIQIPPLGPLAASDMPLAASFLFQDKIPRTPSAAPRFQAATASEKYRPSPPGNGHPDGIIRAGRVFGWGIPVNNILNCEGGCIHLPLLFALPSCIIFAEQYRGNLSK